MISGTDIYRVLSSVVPLYVSIGLGYASIRWLKILTVDQSAGINRYVALIAVPVLGFQVIAQTNVYEMNWVFIGADSLTKVFALGLLALWSRTCPPRKQTRAWVEAWVVTIFMVSVLPNTLIVGVPLLSAMYGAYAGTLMAQIVVIQVAVWFPLVLFLLGLQAAKKESFRQISSRISASQGAGEAEGQEEERKSGGSPRQESAGEGGKGGEAEGVPCSPHKVGEREDGSVMEEGRGEGGLVIFYCGADTPDHSTAGPGEEGEADTADQSTATSGEEDKASQQSARGLPTKRGTLSPYRLAMPTSACEDMAEAPGHGESPQPGPVSGGPSGDTGDVVVLIELRGNDPSETGGTVYGWKVSEEEEQGQGQGEDARGDLGVEAKTSGDESKGGQRPGRGRKESGDEDEDREKSMQGSVESGNSRPIQCRGFRACQFLWCHSWAHEDRHSPGHKPDEDKNAPPNCDSRQLQEGDSVARGSTLSGRFGRSAWGSQRSEGQSPRQAEGQGSSRALTRSLSSSAAASLRRAASASARMWWDGAAFTDTRHILEEEGASLSKQDQRAMLWLTLRIVGYKLVTNPNNYAALLGVAYSLLSFGFGFGMPEMLKNSVEIVGKTGLGMAMFSLGLFMASQKSLVPCGILTAAWTLSLRFVAVPLLMAAAAFAVGIRGTLLQIAIVQAALPPGVATFVFANEYKVNPAVLSTGVSLGTLISFPILITLYVLLGL